MKKIDENTKVTLTLEQLRKIVNESAGPWSKEITYECLKKLDRWAGAWDDKLRKAYEEFRKQVDRFYR